MNKLLICLGVMMLSVCISNSQKMYDLDTDESLLNWKSDYVFKIAGHHGFVKFNDGKLITINGNITGGHFTIDMTTIENVDGGYNEGLVSHLKNEDFFDIYKYPTAYIEFTNVVYNKSINEHLIDAMLTIKDVSKHVKFTAKADGTNNTMTARFKIDRSRWQINYNHDLKDSTISEAVEFNVYLKFK
ncbi:YceI family protein [Croceibacter atlanticus]|uniref:YceI family protein n=1 Tax=Croceibacter atlanticus TaxID=313588 RepID=UPI0030FB7A41